VVSVSDDHVVYNRTVTCSGKSLAQCFSKWAKSPPRGDFDGQRGEKIKGGDRGRKNTKGAKMLHQ